ncbi:MAG: AraC family ligand binding domain-containing protein [Ktedonobacterales bacterium]
MDQHSKAGGSGLERLCRQDWVQSTETEYGVEFIEARFHGHAYQKHRHDTYAICLTTTGVLPRLRLPRHRRDEHPRPGGGAAPR